VVVSHSEFFYLHSAEKSHSTGGVMNAAKRQMFYARKLRVAAATNVFCSDSYNYAKAKLIFK